MKLKDVYITVSEEREIKVVPRSNGKPKLGYVYEDSDNPETIRQCFGMIGFLVESQEAFEELMKVEEFREIRDAHLLKGLDIRGLDPKKVGLSASELYEKVVDLLKAAEKPMHEREIKAWYRGLRKAA